MWGVPTYDSQFLTFSPVDNAQYFTLFKLGTRRCENPILTGHYILHPQPPQSKSCICFYAEYISILGVNIYFMNYISEYHNPAHMQNMERNVR